MRSAQVYRYRLQAEAFAILADPAAACLLLARGTSRPDEAEGSRCERRPEPEPQPEEDAEPEPYVSAVDAARELGRILIEQGATALAKLRPRTVIYLHLTDAALRARAGVARLEGTAIPDAPP